MENAEAQQAECRANCQLHKVRQGVLRTKAVKDLMDTAVVTELDLSKKDEGKKPAKKAAAKKKAAPKKAAEKKEEAVEVKADDAE